MKVSNSRKHQHGLSLLSALFVVALIVLVGMFALKVAPTYMENYAVKEVLLNMKQDQSVHNLTNTKLRWNFIQRAKLSSIYTLSEKNVKVTGSKNSRKLQVHYQVKKPLIHNIEVLMTFDETVLFTKRDYGN